MRQAAQPVRMAPRARSKYRAVKETVDGITFASKKEAAHYGELVIRARVGQIRNLILQPRYGLYVHPFQRRGLDAAELIKIGDWVGDFQFEELIEGRWVTVVQDTKGVRTTTYRLKKRFVEALYGITIHET